MARRKMPALPTGFVISEGWSYGDFPDDVHPTYQLRELRIVTLGHLWWKRRVPQLVTIMTNDSIDVLTNAAWAYAGDRDARAHLEATR